MDVLQKKKVNLGSFQTLTLCFLVYPSQALSDWFKSTKMFSSYDLTIIFITVSFMRVFPVTYPHFRACGSPYSGAGAHSNIWSLKLPSADFLVCKQIAAADRPRTGRRVAGPVGSAQVKFSLSPECGGGQLRRGMLHFRGQNKPQLGSLAWCFQQMFDLPGWEETGVNRNQFENRRFQAAVFLIKPLRRCQTCPDNLPWTTRLA